MSPLLNPMRVESLSPNFTATNQMKNKTRRIALLKICPIKSTKVQLTSFASKRPSIYLLKMAYGYLFTRYPLKIVFFSLISQGF